VTGWGKNEKRGPQTNQKLGGRNSSQRLFIKKKEEVSGGTGGKKNLGRKTREFINQTGSQGVSKREGCLDHVRGTSKGKEENSVKTKKGPDKSQK